MLTKNDRKLNPKLEKFFDFIERYGNSIALYLLLAIILFGVWQLTPIPSIEWTPNTIIMGWLAIFFIALTSSHALLWLILTREFLRLSSKVKLIISTSLRLVRPIHVITGIIGLGLVFLHSIHYFLFGFDWNLYTISGIVGLCTLIILALDGIGLMVSPFLSRKVHRWIAFVFVISVLTHLLIVY